MRTVTLLRTSPALYRLALTWPAVARETITPAPEGGDGDPWRQVRFSFAAWATLADVSPRQVLDGFERLKATWVILPDGSLDANVEKFFKAEGLAAFGVKVKPPKAPDK